MKNTYSVNGEGFDNFFAAIKIAQAQHAEVIEIATGLRRWAPAKVSAKARVRHVLINADGTESEFSKVVR